MKQNWFKVSVLVVLVGSIVYFGAINMYSYRYVDSGIFRVNKITQEVSVFSYEQKQEGWFKLE